VSYVFYTRFSSWGLDSRFRTYETVQKYCSRYNSLEASGK